MFGMPCGSLSSTVSTTSRPYRGHPTARGAVGLFPLAPGPHTCATLTGMSDMPEAVPPFGRYTSQVEEAEAATALVAAIRAGDPAAEAALIARYSEGVHFFLRRRNGAVDHNQDMHQDIFIIVLTKIREGKVSRPEQLAGYIQRVARNVAIADYRKRARAREDEVGEDLPAGSSSPQTALERRQAGVLVKQVLDELGVRDRLLLYRFYLGEEDKERIMSDLGLSSLHFNRVLYRARRRFAELWQKAGRTRGLSVLVWLLGFPWRTGRGMHGT